MRRIERTIEIEAPPERVFDLFSDFESWPRWMEHIKDVRRTGRRYTRWVADAPLGTTVEWEAETTIFQPDRRIAWRSVRGDVETEGEVLFDETGRRTTLLRIILGYSPPGGRLGDAVARLFGANPEEQLDEDLERFRRIAEGRRGSDRSRDYPERGAARDYAARRADYERQRELDERARYGQPAPDRGERGDYEARRGGRRRRDEYDERDFERAASRDAARRRERRDDEREEEARARRGFEAALREARRSQIEGMRRYDEAHEREEHYRRAAVERRRDERAGRGAARSFREEAGDERRAPVRPRSSGTYYYEERDDEERARRDEVEARRDERDAARRRERDEPEYRPRYALTPRERERDRDRRLREREEEAKRMLRRRGVDRLLENPPSREWRRWEDEE